MRDRSFKDWTTEAAKQVDDNSLDFDFIDADHSCKTVREDITTWTRKLKPNGWLIGHGINFPTVKTAVDDMLLGYEVGPDNCWIREASGTKDYSLTGKADGG